MATIVKGKNPNKPYTVRYYHDGRQREKSFTSLREAKDWKVKFEHDSRAQTFVDPRVAGEKFGAVADRWLARHPGSPKTLVNYETALRLHIKPVFGSKPLVEVARDRESMETFIRYVLPGKGLGANAVRSCYMIVNAVINDAVKSGRLTSAQNRLGGIALPPTSQKADVIFATRDQVETMADEMPEGYGQTIYLMRGCGLRLGEALGVQDADLGIGERRGTLRLSRQLAPDGKSYMPLKHRKEDDYRDVPVPGYVIAHLEGDVPATTHRVYRRWFNKARDKAGLPPSFTPHTLRHVFASVCLTHGVPITDVSKWLGHRNINTTYGIYGHLAPESWERARKVLDDEWRGE